MFFFSLQNLVYLLTNLFSATFTPTFEIAAACCDITDDRYQCQPYYTYEELWNCGKNISCDESVTTGTSTRQQTTESSTESEKFSLGMEVTAGGGVDLGEFGKFKASVTTTLGLSIASSYSTSVTRSNSESEETTLSVSSKNCAGALKQVTVYCGINKIQTKHFVCYDDDS